MSITPDLDYTGSDDMSARWSEFIQQSGDVDVELPSGGQLRADAGLTLRGRQRVRIHAQGCETFAMTEGDRTRSHVNIVDCLGTAIHGLKVRGAHPNAGTAPEAYVAALEAQHGFNIVGSPWTHIDKCSAQDVYGDFVYVGKSRKQRSVVVGISGFYGKGTGRQGMSVTDCDGWVVTDSCIGDIRRTAFDLEPNSTHGSVTRGTIQRTVVGAGRLNFVSSHGKGNVSDITVQDITLYRQAMKVSVKSAEVRRTDWRFENIDSNAGIGNGQKAVMLFEGVDGVTLKSCHQPFQSRRQMRLARVIDCTGVDSDVPVYEGRK